MAFNNCNRFSNYDRFNFGHKHLFSNNVWGKGLAVKKIFSKLKRLKRIKDGSVNKAYSGVPGNETCCFD